ncbi:MAG: small-conductance mechanosensitive channel [Bacteroidetes bacterium]|nr:small-conductance mechanosensitive channel [Bacteroidota bacterium]
MKKLRLLLFSFAMVFVLPPIGSYLKWGMSPPGYGMFPAQASDTDTRFNPPVEDPGFNQTIFNFCACVGIVILIFLLFPRLFGFKKSVVVDPPKVKVPFPSWFWPAFVIWIISWLLMWGRFDKLGTADHFTFVPLWWGFIFVLDGIVYRRNNGVSLISSKPVTMKIMAVASAFSWFVFEFQNFFVCDNWYYPNNMVLSNFGNISWQLLSYTTVLPAIFEFYWLLKTFKHMRERYKFGPKIVLNSTMQYAALIFGFVLLFLMGLYPFILFWVLWVSLIPALVPAMSLSKMWTPFAEISKSGDWSPVILIALATLWNGFFWEFWNFGSEWFHDYAPTNPNYWKYSVPYIDKYHIFSEMPILGYFGYLLFGNVCWVLWVALGNICGFNASVEADGNIEST